MPSTKLGNSTPTGIYLGSNPVNAIYLGSTLVWGYPTPVGPDSISLSKTAMLFGTSASSSTLTVTASGTGSYTVADSSGITVFVQSNQVTINCAVNTNDNSRTNSVMFTCGTATATLNITQEGNPSISVTPTVGNPSYTANRESFDITCNREGTVTVSDNGLVIRGDSSGTGNYNGLEISVTENTDTTNNRIGTITFTAGTASVIVTVTQDASTVISPSVIATAKNGYNDTTDNGKNAQSWQVAFNGGTRGSTGNNISVKIVNTTLDPNSNNYVVEELVSNETITAGANQIQYKGVEGANKINQHDEYNLSYNGATVDTNHYTLIVTSGLTTIAQDLFKKTKY